MPKTRKLRARALALVAGLVLLSLAAACRFKPGANPTRGCEQCAPGHCYFGYCVQAAPDAGVVLPGTAGMNAGTAGQGTTRGIDGTVGQAGSGQPSGPCQANQACYLGPPGTRAKGSCRDGMAHCDGATTSACAGQILPTDELCNGLDDDCDGKIDEEIALGSCQAPSTGSCTNGTLRCEAGLQTCVTQAEPTIEVCNGLDDDCDGQIDNNSDVACYPEGAAGCTKNGDGSFACVGACTQGKQVCKDGVLQACAGFVQPTKELCGAGQAVDEDCDGQVDNGCPCSGSQSQTCYSGPFLTAGVGRCRAGMQHCVGGTFGPCEGAITPTAESCANQGADDDCNFAVDDVPGAGLFCIVPANVGACRYGSSGCANGALACRTPAALPDETSCDGNDEDCDGRVDENFNLATDEANCGACGTACGSNQLCCAGGCHTPATDSQNCGRCGHACGDGMACCGGTCIATDSHDHCGGCGGCTSSQTCCGGACVATNSTDHCGGCGACASGQACCGGACVATNTNDHCGGCGACASGQACCGGACVATNSTDHCGGCGGCTSGQACCGGACVATDSTDHCGGCGGCTSSQACCGGACVATDSADHCGGCGACAPGQACCGSACVPTGTHDHCGGCGACAVGEDCCGGGCASISTASNCGGCGVTCSAPCSCASGTCQDAGGAACQ